MVYTVDWEECRRKERERLLADMMKFPDGTDERAALVCNMVPPGFGPEALRDAVRHYIRQYAHHREINL